MPSYMDDALFYLTTLPTYNFCHLPPEKRNCPSCYVQWEEQNAGPGLRVPYRFPCGHVLCKKCIGSMIAERPIEYNLCPFCKTALFPAAPPGSGFHSLELAWFLLGSALADAMATPVTSGAMTSGDQLTTQFEGLTLQGEQQAAGGGQEVEQSSMTENAGAVQTGQEGQDPLEVDEAEEVRQQMESCGLDDPDEFDREFEREFMAAVRAREREEKWEAEQRKLRRELGGHGLF